MLGMGKRLFSDGLHAWPFRSSKGGAVGQDGVLVVRYEPEG